MIACDQAQQSQSLSADQQMTSERTSLDFSNLSYSQGTLVPRGQIQLSVAKDSTCFQMAHKLVVLQGLICCFIHYGGFPGSSENKESTRNTGDLGSTPGFERSPGEGNSYPLQYSCPENYMDRGTWRAIAHEIAELDTPE